LRAEVASILGAILHGRRHKKKRLHSRSHVCSLVRVKREADKVD
jgi:hypothetical protein